MIKKKHADYWKARQEDILRYLDKADIDVSAELSRLYSEQAVEAQKDLYNLYMKYAKDNNLTYQEAQQRLRHEDLSDYRKNAEQYRKQAEKDPELLKRLNEQYVSSRATRLDALALEMTFRAGVLRGLIDKTFEKYLKDSANYAYSKAVGGRAGTINAPVLKQLIETPFNGYNYSQQVWGHVDNLAKDLKEVLKRGFVRGDGVRELAREISKKYEVARHRAETLIRTDGTMVINNATGKRYMDEGLRYYRDLVQLDNRTTKICREVARKDERKLLFEMQPGINAAPYHFNCRTTIVPDDEELDNKPLDKAEEKSYNKGMEGMYRKKVIDQTKMSIASQEQINRLSRKFRKRGGEFIDDEDAIAYLDEKKAVAITLDAYTILKRKEISISALIEELEHAEQYLREENDGSALSVAINEVSAKRKSISERERYKLPKIEVESVRKDIKFYEKEIERLNNENSRF